MRCFKKSTVWWKNPALKRSVHPWPSDWNTDVCVDWQLDLHVIQVWLSKGQILINMCKYYEREPTELFLFIVRLSLSSSDTQIKKGIFTASPKTWSVSLMGKQTHGSHQRCSVQKWHSHLKIIWVGNRWRCCHDYAHKADSLRWNTNSS